MIQRIREVLLTQYIGAIVAALLTVQGIIGIISIPVQYLSIYLSQRHRPTGGLFGAEPVPPITWDYLLPLLVSIVLHLTIAYLIVRWLFLSPATAAGTNRQNGMEEPDDGNVTN